MRKSTLLLATIALAVILAALPARADSTFVVDTTVDNVSATACTAAVSDCSLRGAIIAANNASGADVVEVPGGNYTLTISGAGEDASATGDLDITGALTIDGAGADSTTVAGGEGFGDRIFDNHSGASTTISALTITGGGSGSSSGGGIHNQGALTVSDSTISNNTADHSGGGIYNLRGTLTVNRSTISNNTAGGSGGGILSFTHSITDGSLVASKTTITNSTISANTAGPNGGGGVRNYVGLTEIENSTITNNTATTGQGNGVWSYGAMDTSTKVYSSIISGNDNSENTGTDVDFGAGTNTFLSEDYNLIGDGNATGAFNSSGDKVIGNEDPGLEPLGLNAPGSTQTHALKATSPALNAGAPSTQCPAPATDQRGVDRPQGGRCDIGSFEVAVSSYDFAGFFSPVDNPDVATNKAKAGSSIPVKFSLGGDMGLGIFATGTDANNNTFTYPTSSAMRCDSTDGLDAIEETVTAGGGGLSYDPSLDRYTYVWKTNRAWAGTCRQLVVKLDDDTYHRANFKFVK